MDYGEILRALLSSSVGHFDEIELFPQQPLSRETAASAEALLCIAKLIRSGLDPEKNHED